MWTPEEDAKLQKIEAPTARGTKGKVWSAIAAQHFPNRSAKAVTTRYYAIQAHLNGAPIRSADGIKASTFDAINLQSSVDFKNRLKGAIQRRLVIQMQVESERQLTADAKQVTVSVQSLMPIVESELAAIEAEIQELDQGALTHRLSALAIEEAAHAHDADPRDPVSFVRATDSLFLQAHGLLDILAEDAEDITDTQGESLEAAMDWYYSPFCWTAGPCFDAHHVPKSVFWKISAGDSVTLCPETRMVIQLRRAIDDTCIFVEYKSHEEALEAISLVGSKDPTAKFRAHKEEVMTILEEGFSYVPTLPSVVGKIKQGQKTKAVLVKMQGFIAMLASPEANEFCEANPPGTRLHRYTSGMERCKHLIWRAFEEVTRGYPSLKTVKLAYKNGNLTRYGDLKRLWQQVVDCIVSDQTCILANDLARHAEVHAKFDAKFDTRGGRDYWHDRILRFWQAEEPADRYPQTKEAIKNYVGLIVAKGIEMSKRSVAENVRAGLNLAHHMIQSNLSEEQKAWTQEALAELTHEKKEALHARGSRSESYVTVISDEQSHRLAPIPSAAEARGRLSSVFVDNAGESPPESSLEHLVSHICSDENKFYHIAAAALEIKCPNWWRGGVLAAFLLSCDTDDPSRAMHSLSKALVALDRAMHNCCLAAMIWRPRTGQSYSDFRSSLPLHQYIEELKGRACYAIAHFLPENLSDCVNVRIFLRLMVPTTFLEMLECLTVEPAMADATFSFESLHWRKFLRQSTICIILYCMGVYDQRLVVAGYNSMPRTLSSSKRRFTIRAMAMRALIACDSTEVSEDRRANLREAAAFFGKELTIKHCLAQAMAAYTTNGIEPASFEQIQAFRDTVNHYQVNSSHAAAASPEDDSNGLHDLIAQRDYFDGVDDSNELEPEDEYIYVG
jgi:hypothetical protein